MLGLCLHAGSLAVGWSSTGQAVGSLGLQWEGQALSVAVVTDGGLLSVGTVLWAVCGVSR